MIHSVFNFLLIVKAQKQKQKTKKNKKKNYLTSATIGQLCRSLHF